MATLNDPEVHKLLTEPNYAVVSTLRAPGEVRVKFEIAPEHIRHQKQG
ncbi:MAG: hypothetical protein ACLP4R_08160 [Solirubrobacteraceae bacterium]